MKLPNLFYWLHVDYPPAKILSPNNSGSMYHIQISVICMAIGVLVSELAGFAATLRVGTGAFDLEGDDSMVIAGGISPGKATGQEGKLRCLATVFELDRKRIALVACDVLMLTRQTLDPVVLGIEEEHGIARENVLINCTHTHHAPSTMRVHDYGPDPVFTKRTQEGIIAAVRKAVTNLADSTLHFALGEEKSVGQNSRLMLDDGQIFWIGPRTNVVRPTGPFDPELPVMAVRGLDGNFRSLWFNHSTHTIGVRQPGKRSPSIYGLAAQDLENELGGQVTFFEGASGSTHNLDLSGDECAKRIKSSVLATLGKSWPIKVDRLEAIKRPIKFRVRTFDDAAEDTAVLRYCQKYASGSAMVIANVFRNMRRELANQQGQERETWVQTLRIGDIAIVGVPAEYFTQLGIDIKNRSPFRYTYIFELANDWVGYLPNLEGHKLGGYQVWTGFHSYAEPGTGERIADQAVEMLKELKGSPKGIIRSE